MRILICVSLLCLFACTGERYREDKKNKLTRRAQIANDYLANQAVELTKENNENRDKNSRKSRKNLVKQQKALNEANSNTSKVKPTKKHSGNFRFY